MRQFIAFFAVFVLLVSCEKKVDFNLEEQPEKLVVEGIIETNQPPVFILSRSLNYFSNINPEILEASFVHNAVIEVSNGIKNHRLKEYAHSDSLATIYYYTSDSSNLSSAFAGEVGKAYTVKITAEGKVYQSQTTIPLPAKKVDSLSWRPSPNNPDTTRVIVMARVTDPPGLGNYIRYFTSTNGGPFLPGLNSIFDDDIVDGTSYTVDVEKGVNRNEDIDFENYSYFNRGDTVVLKFTNIDKATFEFWRTMEYNYGSIGNPFSTPVKVLGNISNGALGYFGGYATAFHQIIIPK